MTSRSAPRRSRRTLTILLRFVAYLVLAWGTLAVLAAGIFPGAAAVTLLVAVYSVLPLVAFLSWRGWPFYPSAAFRLLVVRPFWYTQLVLPLVSAAGLLGLILGAPFGEALLVGRIFAGTMLATATVLLVLGYIGTRRLVVRR